MNQIKELPKSSSHLLSCTQIITSIHCVVKELIENALDSSSKIVEVKLEEYGLERIEVKDNGTGINKDDISKVAKPHCTSKITSHLDLNHIETYGFRGEALAALCTVSDLSITTKTAHEDFGYIYSFNHNGDILSSKPFPTTQGTTVTVLNLFKNIPVRKQFYRTDKNKKEELKKIEDILVAFGCIHTEIRFALYHNKSLIWQKPAVNKIRDGLVAIFGNSIVDHMENCEFNSDENEINIEVFLPKCNAPSICGLSSLNRSIVSVNKRPVRMKAIDKVLKEVFSKSLQNSGKSRYPICYVSINVPPSKADVNIEPNKTTVMLHNLDVVIEQLTAILKNFYDPSIENVPEIVKKNVKNNLITVIENYVSGENKTKKVIPISPMKKTEIAIISTPLQTTIPIKSPMNKIKKSTEIKNLSEKPNISMPVAKRLKSSATPKDVQMHINTLDSFFESPNDIQLDCPKLNTMSTTNVNNASDTKTIVNTTIQKNLSHTNTSTESSVKYSSPLENHNDIIPLEINEFSVNHQNCLIGNNSNFPFMTEKRKASENTLEKENKLENPFSVNDNSNAKLAVSNVVCSVTKVDSTVSPMINVTNRENNYSSGHSSFKTAKAVLTENNLITENGSKFLTKQDSLPDKNHNIINASAPNEDLTIENNTENWSRGKLPVESNMEPVTLLKPQSMENGGNGSKNSNSNEEKNFSIEIQNQRRITPFDFFCRKHRFDVASINPDWDNHKIAEILTEKWNRLSVEEKAVYKNMIDKSYPKDIKKKEKIGKVINNNLSKVKKNTSMSKKKPKRKCTKKIIPFSIEILKDSVLSTSNKKLVEEDWNVINYLTPGIWLFSKNNELYLLNTFRLQEIVIYHHLLNTYKFDSEPLQSPWIISANSLGEDVMKVLSHFSLQDTFSKEKILDERIIANGFEISLLKSNEELLIEVMGITKNIAFYGIKDLKEILNNMVKKGIDVKISDCRPSKVVFFLQSEAVRIARQCPPSKKVEEVEDLFNEMKVVAPDCEVCIHSLPIFHKISKFS